MPCWRTSRSRVVALLAGAALAAGCESPSERRIGVVLGQEGVLGAELAIEDLNARGGPPIAIRSLTGAFGSSAQVALQGAESLAVDPTVLAVVGHANSSASLAASQVYNAQRIVQIAPTSTSPLYSQAGPFSYRLVGSDEHQARFLVRQIDRAASKRLAIVYANDDYGRALRGLVVAELAARDIRPVYQGPYAEAETTGTDLVRALVAARPTTLVWLGREPYFMRIRHDLHARLPGLPVLASDGFGGVAVLDDPAKFPGVRFVRLVSVDTGPAEQALRRRYRAAGAHSDMTDQAFLAYDAVLLLGTAIREAGPDRGAIRGWLDQLGRSHPAFRGMTGPIAFSPDGDRASTYQLVTLGGPTMSPSR